MRNSNLLRTLTISLFFINHAAYADGSSITRPDDHAPIGVMRDHVHNKGEYMPSYRFSFMKMKGTRDGSEKISSDDVLENYMMAPLNMTMKMHMAGAMYGVTDNLTLAVMGSFVEKEMQMLSRANKVVDREVSGFGDGKINALYEIFNNSDNRIQLNLGLSVPTGSIKENYQGANLSYPMQLGSGSYEALPGISYSGYQDAYSYGAQVNGTFRLNKNNNNYKLGDSFNATAWTAKKLNDSISISSRLNYTVTQKIKGSDSTLNTAVLPANNTSASAGRSLDLLIGVNFIAQKGIFKRNRLAIETGAPVYQSFKGIRLKTDYKIILGWQKSF